MTTSPEKNYEMRLSRDFNYWNSNFDFKKKGGSRTAFSGLRAVLAALVLLLLAACPMEPGSEEEPPESRNFNVHRVDTSRYESITAQKLAEGRHCIVFVAEDSQVSAGTAKSIAAEYDARIYPKIVGIFGDYASRGYDVDNNGKLILLLVDIQDGYDKTKGGGYVAGFFDGYHMLEGNLSNKADMLFIDINPQVPGSSGFYANIAHELQHLINYANHGGQPQDLWLNEGLSAAAEYLYGGHQEDRVKYFNQDPMGTIAYGNNFFVWDGFWEEKGDTLANYATAYLFFQWLRIHAGGTGIYSAISNSDYRDYRAVTQAAKTWIPAAAKTGAANITDDEKIWDRLLSSWMIANLVNAPKGLYGYKEIISTQVRGFKDNKIFQNEFSPGEGIFSSLEGNKSFSSVAGSGPSIKYVGIGGQPAAPVIVDEMPYTGTALLTYNANSDYRGEDETGYILNYFSGQPFPDSPASAGAARSAVSSGTLPSSYPVSVHDLLTHGSAQGAGSRPAR
jgi:hypothetical protein